MAKKKQRTAYNSKPKTSQTKVKPEHNQLIKGHENHKPAWRMERVDIDHSQWGLKRLTAVQTFSILEKLQEYESRTWKEITSNNKRDHSVPVENLDKQAKKRLLELKYDDFDHLFRLRFTGKQRLWGIKESFVFKILWWDEDHTVCPSEKKYT